jgi:hypothetical protein
MSRLVPIVVASFLGLALGSAAVAHDPEAEARWMLEEELKKPWVAANGFIADFDKALETAAKDKKPVFAFFTVSYVAVPESEKLEKDVLSTPEFKAFSEGVVAFLHVNSGLGGPHADLLREKGGLEVPYFAVLDDQGNVTAKVETRDVKGFEAAVKAGAEFAKLRAKADKTADENVYVVTHEMDVGNLKLQLARERVAALGELTESQRKQVDASLFRLEVWTAVAEAYGSYDKSRAAGKLFAEMWAAGREPAGEELWRPFFMLVLHHAEKAKDAKLFAKALEKLRTRYGDSKESDWQEFFQDNDEILAVMEKAARERESPKDGGDAK